MDHLMTKAAAKASVDDMGKFMAAMNELEETHIWDEATKQFIEKETP